MKKTKLPLEQSLITQLLSNSQARAGLQGGASAPSETLHPLPHRWPGDRTTASRACYGLLSRHLQR